MASQSKSDAARANGAKSKGPTTSEGKARSSKNALKHGLTAQFDTLPGESQEEFDGLLDSHRAHYQPASVLEHELVRTLAITRWRLRRIPTLEFKVLENETILREDEIDDEFSEIDDSGRLGFVFRKLADESKVLSLLIRYEASLTRVHDRVFKHLTALQKLRNEPNRAPCPPSTDPEDPASSPDASPMRTQRGDSDEPNAVTISRKQPTTGPSRSSLQRFCEAGADLTAPGGRGSISEPLQIRDSWSLDLREPSDPTL